MKRTHEGFMFGFVPVYIDMTNQDCPGIEPKYGFGFLFDLCQFFHGVVATIAVFINPEFEPMFCIKITSEINGLDNA